jgi:chemotaxis protein histidine kinase CheA
VPPGREPVAGAERGEMARVSAELLDELLNHAGEVSITRARLEQLFGDRHRFVVADRPGGGAMVEIEIPARRAAAAAVVI